MFTTDSKKLSIVTGCYNEQGNIKNWYNAVKTELAKLNYKYEIIIIDNCSTDKTVDYLREIAKIDKNVKVIINSKNFGVARSPFYAMQQATGDAMIYLASDLQDPPSLIPTLVNAWENGAQIAVGEKITSKESKLMWFIRQTFYKFIEMIEDEEKRVLRNYTGYGIYDKKIIQLMREYDNPNPYIKNFITEIGFDIVKIPFKQNKRIAGETKHTLKILFDCAFSIMTNASTFPIRFMIFAGFIISALSILVAICYFIYKITHWDSFSLGIAPLVIGLFLFSSFQIMFIGILGEYIISIYKRVDKKPLVIEKERINF